jgi:hypothetical protein
MYKIILVRQLVTNSERLLQALEAHGFTFIYRL